MSKTMKHTEIIICPECECMQEAEVIHTTPWNTYIHHCNSCEYVIMESEWNRAKSFDDLMRIKETFGTALLNIALHLY